MRVENRPTGLFTVTPGRGLRMGFLIAGVLVGLLVLIEIAARPMRDLYGPLVWAAAYEGAPLERVMQDLEQRKVIPEGTSWADESLKMHPVTGRWLLAPPGDVLQDVGVSAVVRIEYPVGYHGDMIGPAKILPASASEAGISPRMNRDLELKQLEQTQSAAPN